MSVWSVVIAVAAAIAIWVVLVWFVRALSTPPPEVNPEDIVPIDQDYRCSVCGAEVTMRAVNPQEDKAPKHCREEMVPVWRPG